MRRSFSELLIYSFLIFSTLAVYIQVANHKFVDFDDNLYIIDNRHIQVGFSSDSITWAFTSTKASNWHPLTWLSHMLDFQLYGLNPSGHHLTNLFLHIVNTLLLFMVLKRMTNALWCSAFVASLFALHPLHVESVAWAAERKDVLSTFFWMLTLWFYASYSEKPTLQKYFMALLAFVLGLMAKPMLVVLPFVLLLLDYWPLGYSEQKQAIDTDSLKAPEFINHAYRKSHPLCLILEKVPFFILTGFSSFLTFFVQQSGGAVSSLESLSFKIRVLNALVAYVSYIGKMIWPHHLAPFYPHSGFVPIWQATGAGLFLVTITVLAVCAIRQSPYFLVGWLWYLGTLVPVIGLIQVGSQSMADRYTYVSLIGLFIIIAWGMPDMLAKWRYHKPVLIILTGVLLSALMINTWFQVRIWRNTQSLFKHMIRVTGKNYFAYNGLGLAFAEEGKKDEAIAFYIKALKAKPNYINALNNYGNILNDTGKLDEAKALFLRALEIKPDFADAHINLGNVLTKQDEIEKAIVHYHKALRIAPDIAETHYNLGLNLSILGKTDEAIFYYRKAGQINPNYADAHTNLGSALAKQGQFDEAVEHFIKALRIKPHDATAHYNLGLALDMQGKINEAIAHYSEALRLKPDLTLAKKNLEALKRPNRSKTTNK